MFESIFMNILLDLWAVGSILFIIGHAIVVKLAQKYIDKTQKEVEDEIDKLYLEYKKAGRYDAIPRQ